MQSNELKFIDLEDVWIGFSDDVPIVQAVQFLRVNLVYCFSNVLHLVDAVEWHEHIENATNVKVLCGSEKIIDYADTIQAKDILCLKCIKKINKLLFKHDDLFINVYVNESIIQYDVSQVLERITPWDKKYSFRRVI